MMRTNKEIDINAGIVWKYWLAKEEKLCVEDNGMYLSLAFYPYF